MDTPNTETKKEPKWRLLKGGEEYQHGDKLLLNCGYNEWTDIYPGVVGMKYEDCDTTVRRPMTPAEEHAEELLSWMKYLVQWMNPAPANPNALAALIQGAETVIAKAEGRQAPTP